MTSDYIWRLARTVSAKTLYRGIRTWRKDGPAERWLELLNLVGPLLLVPLGLPLRTAYLQADPRYEHVSSSLVRERCGPKGRALSAALGEGAWVGDLVPESIEPAVREAYKPDSGDVR